ncbi:MAG: hypothetical protein ABR912_16495 [Terracidiphilus sp.]|jgi:hypothetical protein
MRRLESASSNCAARRLVPQAARLALCLALVPALPGGSQIAPPQPHGGFGQQMGQNPNDPLAQVDVPQYSVEEAKRLRALNALRQKSLVEDTNKLLRLAAELNAEVSSAHPDALTTEQLHKLAEIEKLAHSVKDKMSVPMWGTPVYPQPFSPSLH